MFDFQILFNFFSRSRGCMEGCYCPDGYYEDNSNTCVKKEECACVHNGMVYKYGDTREEGCNTWYAYIVFFKELFIDER